MLRVPEVLEGELFIGTFDKAFMKVSAADGDVAIISTDLDLVAIAYWATLGIDAQHHGGFATAVADGFDFRQSICPSEQVLASFEKVSLKVRAKAICKDGDRQSVADISQLADLGFDQELGFIDQNAVDRSAGMFTFRDAEKVIRGVERDRVRGEADAGADFSFAETVVDFGGEDQGPHSTFPIVVARLQEVGGFPCVHSRVVEV